jgi:RNA polymerase sigma-70 factor (ECF subfamily)
MSDATREQSTATLLERIRGGQDAAREELFRRCLPLLKHFARGRLPMQRRDLAETDDLVQVTLLRALNNVERFDAQGRGAFFAYLRQIMLNAVREEIRRHGARPQHTADLDAVPAAPDSVVANAVGEQTLEAYEAGLVQLGDLQREAVILRVEFDMSYAEIAVELDCASTDAARMQVARGLKRLAELMP